MVEKKKSGYWLTHLGLILGVLFIFFPVWLTFVASTVTQDAIIQPPLPVIPGGEFFENYANADPCTPANIVVPPSTVWNETISIDPVVAVIT